jgi:hypothetical protein
VWLIALGEGRSRYAAADSGSQQQDDEEKA